MTTNYERIKQLSLDEMAELFNNWDFICDIAKSKDGIKQWLEKECE